MGQTCRATRRLKHVGARRRQVFTLHRGDQGQVLRQPAGDISSFCALTGISHGQYTISFLAFLSFPSTRASVLAELHDFGEGEHWCASDYRTDDSWWMLSWRQGGTGPEFMCLILKHFFLGQEKQWVLYRHEEQISLRKRSYGKQA